MKIRAPHKGKFSLDMIEQPIALLQALNGNVFHLGNCVQVRLQVNTPPALLTQGQDILNRAALLLPARIREGFCDRPLRKIECVGKTERHKVAGKTSEVSDTFVEKLFHLAWDVDCVPYRFHKQSVSRLMAFVKKSIQRATLPEVGRTGHRRKPRAILAVSTRHAQRLYGDSGSDRKAV